MSDTAVAAAGRTAGKVPNRIVNAIKLDVLTARFFLGLYPLLFVLALVIGSLVKMPVFTVILTIALAVFIVGGVFSVNERNHGEKLYGTLPLTRRDMVLGRYLYALILGVLATVIAGGLGWVASRIGGVGMGSLGPSRGDLAPTPAVDTMIFWAAIGFAFVYFCFAVAVAFPIYFRFGFSKAYVLTMLPLYLVVLIALLVTRNLNPTLALTNTLQFLADHVYIAPLIGVAGGLVLLAVSIVISLAIYRHKET